MLALRHDDGVQRGHHDRRRREVVRRRRGHQRARGPDSDRRARPRDARPARARSDRAPRQAGDRRDQRLRARRRLRAGDGLHDPHRGRHREARSARDQPRAHSRLRRHAAARPAGRQGAGARTAPDRRPGLGGGGAPDRAGQPGRRRRRTDRARRGSWLHALAAKAPIAVRYIIDAVNKGLEMPSRRGAGLRGDAVRTRRRAPRTCAKGPGRFSRSASRSSRGSNAVRHTDSATPSDLPSALARIASRSSCRASTRRSPTPARRRARGAGRGGAPAAQIEEMRRARARSRSRRRRDARPRPAGSMPSSALGCVIRGATPHFEYISSAVAHGIMEASGDTGVPMAFGVLTTDTWSRRRSARALGRDNKGWEAAAAAIEMAMLFRRLGRTPAGRRRAPRPFGFDRLQARHRSMTAVDSTVGAARAKRRCRCSTRWEVGRASAHEAHRHLLAGRDDAADARRPSRCASSPTGWCAARCERAVAEIDALIAAHAQNWRIERMAVLDRLVLRLAVYELLARAGDAGQVDHQRGARAGAHLQRRRSGRRSSTACSTRCAKS